MDHQVGVRVGHRGQDVEEEPQTRRHVETPAVAWRSMCSPATCSSTRYGVPERREAGIEQMRDLRMGEPREDTGLAGEALGCVASEQRRVQQLDGGALRELAVAALSQPYRAHAALADRLDQPVGADLQAGAGAARPSPIETLLEKAGGLHQVELAQPAGDRGTTPGSTPVSDASHAARASGGSSIATSSSALTCASCREAAAALALSVHHRSLLE